MARPHLEWIASSDVPEEPVVEGPLAGARQRILSLDGETSARTSLVDFPAGWEGHLAGTGGLTELFVVDGELRADGRRLGRGGYVRLGPSPRPPVVVSRPSTVLVMVDPTLLDAPATLALDTESMPWEPPVRGGLPGIGVKELWDGAGGAPVTLVAANVPRFDSAPEFHACPEEIFVLAGDVGNDTIRVGPGDYLWRPAFVTHGPYHSETGLLVLVRGHGPIAVHWIDDPHATVADNQATFARLRAAGRALDG